MHLEPALARESHKVSVIQGISAIHILNYWPFFPGNEAGMITETAGPRKWNHKTRLHENVCFHPMNGLSLSHSAYLFCALACRDRARVGLMSDGRGKPFSLFLHPLSLSLSFPLSHSKSSPSGHKQKPQIGLMPQPAYRNRISHSTERSIHSDPDETVRKTMQKLGGRPNVCILSISFSSIPKCTFLQK